MSTASGHKSDHKFIEGGLFYPTGYIVAAFPQSADALRVQRDLVAGGYDAAHDCRYATCEEVAAEAEREVRSSSLLALFGHSLQARETHVDLAREGCHFLIIHASSHDETDRVIRVLSRVPVRYVVKYHLLVIEDITERVPSAGRATAAA